MTYHSRSFKSIDCMTEQYVSVKQSLTSQSYYGYMGKNSLTRQSISSIDSKERNSKFNYRSLSNNFKNEEKRGKFSNLPQDVLQEINKLPSHAISILHPKNVEKQFRQPSYRQIPPSSADRNKESPRFKSQNNSVITNLPKVMDVHISQRKMEASQLDTIRNSESQQLSETSKPDLTLFMKKVQFVRPVKIIKAERPRSAQIKIKKDQNEKTHQQVVQSSYYGQNEIVAEKLTRVQSNFVAEGENIMSRDSTEDFGYPRNHSVSNLNQKTAQTKENQIPQKQKRRLKFRRRPHSVCKISSVIPKAQFKQRLEIGTRLKSRMIPQSELNNDISQYITLSGEVPQRFEACKHTPINIIKNERETLLFQQKTRNSEAKIKQTVTFESVESEEYDKTTKSEPKIRESQEFEQSPSTALYLSPAQKEQKNTESFKIYPIAHSLSVKQIVHSVDQSNQILPSAILSTEKKDLNNMDSALGTLSLTPKNIDALITNISEHFTAQNNRYQTNDVIKVIKVNKTEQENKIEESEEERVPSSDLVTIPVNAPKKSKTKKGKGKNKEKITRNEDHIETDEIQMSVKRHNFYEDNHASLKLHEQNQSMTSTCTMQQEDDDQYQTRNFYTTAKSSSGENSPYSTPEKRPIRMWSGHPYVGKSMNVIMRNLKEDQTLINRTNESFINLESVQVPKVQEIKGKTFYSRPQSHVKPRVNSFDFDQVQRPIQEKNQRAFDRAKKDNRKRELKSRKIRESQKTQNSEILRATRISSAFIGRKKIKL